MVAVGLPRGRDGNPALQSRLGQNTFATSGRADFSGPVVRLIGLTPEDFHVLLQKIRGVYAFRDAAEHLLPTTQGIVSVMAHCSKRIGNTCFRTHRATITAFITLPAGLGRNKGSVWPACWTAPRWRPTRARSATSSLTWTALSDSPC
jgi:hypothetical protein